MHVWKWRNFLLALIGSSKANILKYQIWRWGTVTLKKIWACTIKRRHFPVLLGEHKFGNSLFIYLKNPNKTKSYKEKNHHKNTYGFISNLDDFPKKNRLYWNSNGSQLSLSSYFTFKHYTFKLCNHVSYAEFLLLSITLTSDKSELSE